MADHVFLKRMLASLSVDEILLSMYANWLTNFRGLSFNVEMAPYFFKTHEFCFICVRVETNAFYCLLQAK